MSDKEEVKTVEKTEVDEVKKTESKTDEKKGSPEKVKDDEKNVEKKVASPPKADLKQPERDTNLYVRNLPIELSEDLLLATFQPYGTVLEHTIMKDFATNLSLGFGFVRYEKANQAAEAIKELNGHMLGTVPLIVKLAESGKESDNKSNNVYIKQMPLSWQEHNVKELFSHYGTIQESIVLKDLNTGASRGLAFVRYGTEDEAARAIHSLHGYTPPGATQSLVVRFAETEDQKKKRVKRSTHPTPTMAAAGYTHGGANYGQYMAAHYTQQSYGGQSYASYGAAVSAARGASNRYSPYGQQQHQHGATEENTNLFVFHLPGEVDDSGLYQLFSPFGTLESVKVCCDNSGMSKGYGFVKYYSQAEAAHAIQMMNGYKIGSKFLKVALKGAGGRR